MKSEVGSRKSEVRSPKSEVRSPKSGLHSRENRFVETDDKLMCSVLCCRQCYHFFSILNSIIGNPSVAT